MHYQVQSNTQIHPWTGGKSPLHHELYKCDEPTNTQQGGDINNHGRKEYSSTCVAYSSRGCSSYGKQSRPGEKAIVKGIPPDNPLTLENIRKGHNLAASKLPFLWKLHEMLDDVEKTGDQHIVSWFEHGRSFRVHKPRSFVQKIIPLYFNQSKYKSFQRQLHLYEFTRITRGPETGAYSHPKFIRGKKSLCLPLSPKKIKGKINKKNKLDKGVSSTHTVEAAKTGSSQLQKYFSCTGVALLPADQKDAAAWDLVEGGNHGTEDHQIGGGKTDYDASQWMTKLRKMLVTGASLAAQMEQKSRASDSSTPHQGDMVYVFGGMPFRYIDNSSNLPGFYAGDFVDDLSDFDESAMLFA